MERTCVISWSTSKIETPGKMPHHIGHARRILRAVHGAGHPRAGRAIEQARRKHQEEVRLQAVPLHVAEARYGDRNRFAGDVERELVAQLQTHGLLEVDGHRHQRLAMLRWREPVAFGYAVACADVIGPGEILFARSEAFALAILEVTPGNRRIVDGQQAAADHRRHARQLRALPGQQITECIALGTGDIHEEIIRRIGRQARAPVLDQVATHDGQQQQRG